MEKFGRKVVQLRIPILLLGLALLIPSLLGYVNTRVNYDILSYLPRDIETMVGQDILVDEFGTGAFSMFVVEGMEPKDVVRLKQEIEQVEHVEKVIWYDTVMEAVTIACQSSVKSIVVSALSFFAATFGVGLYSNIDMISSLCTLMARGALISMVSVIFILPSMFMIFDRIIIRKKAAVQKGVQTYCADHARG